jgi:ribosomal protein S18 acetylase RimI-like enzyme
VTLPSSFTYGSRVNASVREAREDDGERVAELWTEAYCGSGPGERRAPYVFADFREARRAGRVLVAVTAGEIAGVVVLYPPGPGRSVPRTGEVELSRLAVRGAYRGQGIGRKLVRLSLTAAAQGGAEAVVLWSRPHQQLAHRLYESLGFRRDPRRDGADGEGEQMVFRLELGPARGS